MFVWGGGRGMRARLRVCKCVPFTHLHAHFLSHPFPAYALHLLMTLRQVVIVPIVKHESERGDVMQAVAGMEVAAKAAGIRVKVRLRLCCAVLCYAMLRQQ